MLWNNKFRTITILSRRIAFLKLEFIRSAYALIKRNHHYTKQNYWSTEQHARFTKQNNWFINRNHWFTKQNHRFTKVGGNGIWEPIILRTILRCFFWGGGEFPNRGGTGAGCAHSNRGLRPDNFALTQPNSQQKHNPGYTNSKKPLKQSNYVPTMPDIGQQPAEVEWCVININEHPSTFIPAHQSRSRYEPNDGWIKLLT